MRLEDLGRVALPADDLGDDSQRLAGAVGPGDVAGELLVGEVGVVLERTGRLDEVDAPAVRAEGQLGAPDGGVEVADR